MSKNKETGVIKIITGSRLLDIVIIILAIFIFLTNYHFDFYDSRSECVERWQGSNQTVKFTKQSGCMIKIYDAWIKEDNITVPLTSKVRKETYD